MFDPKEYRRLHSEELREYRRRYYRLHSEKAKEYVRKYSSLHPEKVREWYRRYYHAHSEKVMEYHRKYDVLHSTHVRKYHRNYRKLHLDKEREQHRKYYRLHPEKVLLWKAERRKGMKITQILGKRFPGSHLHHINLRTGVYIPERLHRSIAHDVRTGRGMAEINAKAMLFYESGYF